MVFFDNQHILHNFAFRNRRFRNRRFGKMEDIATMHFADKSSIFPNPFL